MQAKKFRALEKGMGGHYTHLAGRIQFYELEVLSSAAGVYPELHAVVAVAENELNALREMAAQSS